MPGPEGTSRPPTMTPCQITWWVGGLASASVGRGCASYECASQHALIPWSQERKQSLQVTRVMNVHVQAFTSHVCMPCTCACTCHADVHAFTPWWGAGRACSMPMRCTSRGTQARRGRALSSLPDRVKSSRVESSRVESSRVESSQVKEGAFPPCRTQRREAQGGGRMAAAARSMCVCREYICPFACECFSTCLGQLSPATRTFEVVVERVERGCRTSPHPHPNLHPHPPPHPNLHPYPHPHPNLRGCSS